MARIEQAHRPVIAIRHEQARGLLIHGHAPWAKGLIKGVDVPQGAALRVEHPHRAAPNRADKGMAPARIQEGRYMRRPFSRPPSISPRSSVLLVPSRISVIRRLTLCPRMPMNVESDGGTLLANGLGRVTWLMAG